MRPIISGLIGAILTLALLRFLARLSPIGSKPHDLSWYTKRYEWIEWVALAVFLAGILVGLSLYTAQYVATNDPRGAAVGFALGCLGSLLVLLCVCTLSRRHRFREYQDFQELKYGAKNKFALYIVAPFFGLAVYGTLDLLLEKMS